jgi:hypothetical protein
MAVAAHLIRDEAPLDRRGGDRLPTSLDATLRDPAARPLDAVVYDLSPTGFRVEVGETLPIGSVVRIGFSGIGSHPARVVWGLDGMYGCAFRGRISATDIERAIVAAPVVPARFPGAMDPWTAVPEPEVRKWPAAARLTVMIGTSALLWFAIAAGVAAIA